MQLNKEGNKKQSFFDLLTQKTPQAEIIAKKFELRSNFLATQQRKSELFSAFAARKFGGINNSSYLCSVEINV